MLIEGQKPVKGNITTFIRGAAAVQTPKQLVDARQIYNDIAHYLLQVHITITLGIGPPLGEDFKAHNLKHKLDRGVSKYGRTPGGKRATGWFGTMNNETKRTVDGRWREYERDKLRVQSCTDSDRLAGSLGRPDRPYPSLFKLPN